MQPFWSRLGVAALAWAMSLAACGGSDGGAGTTTADADAATAPPDTSDATVTSTGDASDASDTGAATDTGATADADTDDADTSGPAADGAPCDQASDCASGVCIGPAGARICATACDDDGDCGANAACVATKDGGDVCVALRDGLVGLPCAPDGDPCRGGTSCVDTGATGWRCAEACDAGGCEDGFTCGGDGVCAPVGGWRCTAIHVASGVEGDCSVSNQFGTCAGTLRCEVAGGPPSCSAPAPAEEVCDGDDNDCDGGTDDVPCDDDDPCTADSCGANGCVHAPRTGEGCDDGDPCTTGDGCAADGQCVGVSGACECEDEGDCEVPAAKHADCVTVSCDGTPGACVVTHTNAGLACGGVAGCLGAGTCNANGACVGEATLCDDGNPCTQDSCGDDGQCVFEALDDGAGCDDGDACTTGEVCGGGVCDGTALDCTAWDLPCAAGMCDAGVCSAAPITCDYTLGAFATPGGTTSAHPAGYHGIEHVIGLPAGTAPAANATGHRVQLGIHAIRRGQ